MSDKVIRIRKSPTADTRTCDFKNVSKATLMGSSQQHICDVWEALKYFQDKIRRSGVLHDWDKIQNIDEFHADFVTGFDQHSWWDNHRKVNRHHLQQPDGVPEDVNLIDVLDMIADCVMAGMARSGSVYEIKIDPEVLMLAFKNTIEDLKSRIVVDGLAGKEVDRA